MNVGVAVVGRRGLAADLDPRLMRPHALIQRDGRRLEVSATALPVLAQLRESPQRVTDLAAAARIAQPSMAALLSRLQARGWIDRASDHGDGRTVLVSLSEHGRLALTRHAGQREGALHARLAGLSPHRREALAAALPAIDELIEQWEVS